MTDPPLLDVTLDPSGPPRVDGPHRLRFGHVIDRPDGRRDGIHAEWAWDGARVVISGDRYGFQPLFYWCNARRFVASPILAAVASRMDERRFDRTALAAFAHLGYFIGEDTPLEGVKVLPPGAELEWDGTLRLKTTRPLGVANEIGYEAAVEGYIELFRQAIARRPPVDERFTVTLSGGRDSRHILLELIEQGHTPTVCVSSTNLPPVASVDVPPARALCAALGIEHEVVSPPARFTAERRRAYRTSLCCDEHEWMVGLVDAVVGRFSTVWDGVSGDTLSAPRLQPPEHIDLFERQCYEELAERILGRSIDTLQSVLPESMRHPDPRTAARRRLAEELRVLEGSPNPLAMFNVFNRGRREIAMMSTAMLAGVPTAYCPFLDHDLFDFLAGLPADVRYRPEFHDDVIARSYPAVADVPYAPKGHAVPATATYAVFASKAIVSAAANHPGWIGRAPALLWQWTRFGLSRSARARSRWLSPGRMLLADLMLDLVERPDLVLERTLPEPGLADQGAVPAAVTA